MSKYTKQGVLDLRSLNKGPKKQNMKKEEKEKPPFVFKPIQQPQHIHRAADGRTFWDYRSPKEFEAHEKAEMRIPAEYSE